jgi:hypothetical protein
LKLIIEMSGIEAKDAMKNGSLNEFLSMNISEDAKEKTVVVKEEQVSKKHEEEEHQVQDQSEETQSSGTKQQAVPYK